MTNKTLKVSSFTLIPGPRFKASGDNSAEEFFEDYVKPILDDPKVEVLTIDFGGTWGYPASFTSQLGRYLINYTKSYEKLRKKVVAVSADDPAVVERFWEQAKEQPDA